MLASMSLLAIYLGLIPDQRSQTRASRVAMAEVVAAAATMMIANNDFARLQEMFEFALQRNPELLSVALRRNNGVVVASVGSYQELPKIRTDAQIQVSLFAAAKEWGVLELRFTPNSGDGWYAFVFDSRLQAVAFLLVSCFVGFYFYLGRVLRQLDPSRAIPERVRAAFDTLAAGVLVLDSEGFILLANEAFAVLIGKTPESLIGNTTSIFQWKGSDGLALAAEQFPWTESLANGASVRDGRIWLLDAAGKERSFLVNSSGVLQEGGKYGGVLISFDDVTQLQEKELELRRAKEEADTANQVKSDFLANMSHEIRTPMNAVLGFADLLRRKYAKGDADLSKHLQTIYANGKHLLELINSILDLSKVESGRLDLNKASCAPHEIINEVVTTLRLRAQEKGLSLRFECIGPVPEAVISDASRLRQILINLIGNAIKFTKAGSVTVTLELRSIEQSSRLSIEVKDTGIGIPEDKLDAIFEPFVQAEHSTSRDYGGTGLGLAISRRLARALGGDIVARSEFARGSTFTVTIDPGPLDAIRLLDAGEAVQRFERLDAATSSPWLFTGTRVLVVDDGEANREFLQLALEEVGIEVCTAENGHVGVDTALTQQFDAVLMDMQMPVMDGFTATQQLRRSGFTVPIIALTANAMKGYEQELLSAGCNGYLTKPVDIDNLLGTLARFLEGVSMQGFIPAPSHAVRSLTSNASIASRFAQHPRLGIVARKFARQLPERVQGIEHALRSEDLEQLASLAHWLKGTAGTIGFDVLSQAAQRLEAFVKAGDLEHMVDVVHELKSLADSIVRQEEDRADPEATELNPDCAAEGTSRKEASNAS